MKKLKSQLRHVYLYNFFSGMMFFYGIEQLFLDQIGDGTFIRAIMLIVFSVTTTLSNIPAGAFSDIWGRVRSMRLGILLLMASLVVLGFSQNIWHYTFGSILFTLFWSFDSGAKEAFIYDTLADHHKTKDYEKILGKTYAYLLAGVAVANISSGFMANATSLRSTFFISLIPGIVAFYLLSKLHEPDHHKQTNRKILNQISELKKTLLQKRTLLLLIIAQIIIYTISSLVGEFSQVSIVEYTDSAIVLGLVWAGLAITLAFANTHSHRIKNIHIAGILSIITMLTYLFTSNSWISLLPLGIAVAMMEAITVKSETAIQNNTPKHLRSTVSSVPLTFSTLAILPAALWVGSANNSIAYRLTVLSVPTLILSLAIYRTAKY